MVLNTGGLVRRVSLSLDPEHVELLDRLAAAQHSSRSAEVRTILEAARPVLESLVTTMEAVIHQKARVDEAIRGATEREVVGLMPEIERIQQTFLGVMSRLEGQAAAAAEHEAGAASDDGPER